MPLTMLKKDEIGVIKKVSGKSETKKFLNSLGFIENEQIKIISSISGNLIVEIKDSRVAINKELANKIFV